MNYLPPNFPVVSSFMSKGRHWQIVQHERSFYARHVRYNSDTGPFSTIEQAEQFARLENQ